MWAAVVHKSYVTKWVALRLISSISNFCTGGSFYETLCARVGRQTYVEAFPAPVWRVASFVLDRLFHYEDRHCFRQFIAASRRRNEHKWRIQWLWQMS